MANARRLKCTTQGSVEFYETDNTSRIRLQAPSALAGDLTYTLPGTDAAGYLKSNGSGVLSIGAGSATLQQAYDTGQDITLTAPLGGITFTAPAGTTDPVLDIDNTGENPAVFITQRGADNPCLYLSTTTGHPTVYSEGDVMIANVKGLVITDHIGNRTDAIRRSVADVLTIGDSDLVEPTVLQGNNFSFFSGLTQTAELDATGHLGLGNFTPTAMLDITQAANVMGLRVNKSGNGAGNAVDITNSGTANGIYVSQVGTGYGIFVHNAGAEDGIRIEQDNDGDALHIVKAASANASISISHSGTSAGIVLATSTAAGISIAQGEDFYGLHIERGAGSANTKSILYIDNNNGVVPSIWVESTGAPGGPAQLSAAGVWTDSPCYRELKTDIQQQDEKQILKAIEGLSVSKYRNKGERQGAHLRYGLFLDELVEKFGFEGNGVSGTEVATLAIAGVKALTARLNELESKIK